MERLKTLVESQRFERAIIALIVINAVTLGLETSKPVMEAVGPLLLTIDTLILGVFVVELAMKFAVYRLDFFRSPWRVFDLIIVSIALIPAAGPFSVLRALRILRVLRLISAVPSMRRVVGGLLTALPGLGSIVLLLLLVFYVFSVMATKLFGGTFPQWFGSIPASAYSLFQIMTLESWSMGIVRPVMDAFPWAWAFFIPFIAATTFTVLNLFIGVVVSAMQAEHDAQAADERETLHNDQTMILEELRALREEVRALRSEREPGAVKRGSASTA
ncbi:MULTISPECIES: ion transporter [unclassified Roseitalea]|uniref:ion transporter n=1 Tax=unclassified Roseitalea TaxID=2639107 RepID=UPI00273DE653|nr:MULTISPECIES: ion transporter [unclassified Roseitalea]